MNAQPGFAASCTGSSSTRRPPVARRTAVTVTHYRVLLRGENFLLKIDGKPTRMGFFTTRFVQANNRDGAELLAVDLIRHDKRLNDAVSNERADPPMLFADEIAVVDEGQVPVSSSGYSFFPMDSSDAGGSDA